LLVGIKLLISSLSPETVPNFIFVKNTNSLRRENPIGEPFFELSEVDSSNNYAMGKVQANMAVHGTTWFAHYQNAGKGQRGKQWKAEPGQNLMMSCVLEPTMLSVDNQFLLNAMVALGCFEFFNKYAVEGTSIKWPNDIYWEDRKAGGILIENVLMGSEWKYSIVGIGININQTLFPKEIRNPVSLKQITGRNFNSVELARELCQTLESKWKRLATIPFNGLLPDYTEKMYKKDAEATFRTGDEIFTAFVRGIDQKGQLILQRPGATEVAHSSIEWILS